jgi:outer membrane lipoprotein-sorting protein
MTNKQHNPDTKLESAVDWLRDLSPPPGPTADFRQALIARLVSVEQGAPSPVEYPTPRRTTMRRILGIAASFVIVAGMAGWVASLSRAPTGSAFAHMLRQVADVRTAVFVTRAETSGVSNAFVGKTMLREPDGVREETGEGDNRRVRIFDMRELKSLALAPAEKKAVLHKMLDVPPSHRKNLVEQLRELRESSSQFERKEQINGHDTLKYVCNHPTGHYQLWIAEDSQLPVKVVMTDKADEAKSTVKITHTDFEWNVALDASLFSLDVPEGYELEEKQQPAPGLDPKNFIATLKAYVRLNNEEFPDEFNALTVGSMVKLLDDPSLPEEERMANYRRKLAQAMDHPEWDKLSDDEWKKIGPEFGHTLAQGAVFLEVLSLTHEWHYVGKGVKLGDGEKIVAWWAPKAGDEPKIATVLYGDFRSDTKPSDGLPTGD